MGNEKGLITGWMIKLVLGLAITAVVLFDASVSVVNFFTLDGVADDVARAIQQSVIDNRVNPRNERLLRQEGRRLAREHDARLLAVEVEGEVTVRVRLSREADTHLLGRLSFLDNFTTATADGRAGTT